jgi:putative DNA methylase
LALILVCHKRAADAPTATRREFVNALKVELPQALAHLQASNIAPVDLAQAAIGPGMAVYTRYSGVLDAEGKALTVREALSLINQTLDEAHVLARAKNTSVEGLEDAGILKQGRGKVRLFKPEELPADWDPATDMRLNAWGIVHHLIRELASGGEGAAAELVAKLGSKAELAYRLYTLSDRKKRAAEALAYNGLVQSWPEIARLTRETPQATPVQTDLL